MPIELTGSARAIGMGEAFLAVADDEWAALYNPAGLTDLVGWGISGAYAQQFGAVSVSTVAAAGPWLGGMLTLVDSGLIEAGVSYVSIGGVAAVGIPVWGGFSIGARGRAVRTVHPGDASGWTLDLAILWRGPVTVGLVGRSLWSQDVRGRGDHSEPWPRGLAVGMALPFPLPHPFAGQLAACVEGLGEEPLSLRVGSELWIHGIGIRVGIAPSTLSYGFSVRWGGVQLDGAAVLHEVLAPAYRGTLTIRLQ